MTPLLSTPLLRTQSDRRLAAMAGDGHDRAFEAIVERYRRPLQRYLRRLLAEPLAEDVLQATFVRAWQALRVGTDVRDLRPWLYRIAHNQAVNALRAAGAALPDAPDVPLVASPEIEVERREELRATLDGIEALPDRQRAALLAVAVADRPHADVAAELGLSDGALRQLLLRARTALRAATTAITPYPFMTWLAAGQDATAARVTEVAAGAGGAGVAIKAGAAVLAAGAVVAGAPALRDEHVSAPAKPAPAVVRNEVSAPAPAALTTPAAGRSASGAVKHRDGASGTSGRHHGASSRGRSGSGDDDGSSHGSGSSGPGSGGSESDDSRGGGSDGSGSGSGESGSTEQRHDDGATLSHSGDDTSGPSEGEGSSGSPSAGGSDDAAPSVTSGTTRPREQDGESSSASSGSGSSGSDSSGSDHE
jgi:RNA polymerase sigma factor (sigma-70 family)